MSAFDASKFLGALGHFKPNLRILELGAGSGSRTTEILQYLRHEGGQELFSKYVVADASTGLINEAKRRLQGFKNVEFAYLNIGKDLDNQDFGGEEFDLIIIGAGATGTGIALDAVTRGFKVALVEREDFSAGTSSKSTKSTIPTARLPLSTSATNDSLHLKSSSTPRSTLPTS